MMAALVVLAACGSDWGVGDPERADIFRGRFRYYYAESCRSDAFGKIYDCKGVYSLERSMPVSLLIEWDGYAVLNLDGTTYRYYEQDYSWGDDGISSFYQFYENDESITVYTDGSEMVYINNWTGEAIFYYSYLL